MQLAERLHIPPDDPAALLPGGPEAFLRRHAFRLPHVIPRFLDGPAIRGVEHVEVTRAILRGRPPSRLAQQRGIDCHGALWRLGLFAIPDIAVSPAPGFDPPDARVRAQVVKHEVSVKLLGADEEVDPGAVLVDWHHLVAMVSADLEVATRADEQLYLCPPPLVPQTHRLACLRVLALEHVPGIEHAICRGCVLLGSLDEILPRGLRKLPAPDGLFREVHRLPCFLVHEQRLHVVVSQLTLGIEDAGRALLRNAFVVELSKLQLPLFLRQCHLQWILHGLPEAQQTIDHFLSRLRELGDHLEIRMLVRNQRLDEVLRGAVERRRFRAPLRHGVLVDALARRLPLRLLLRGVGFVAVVVQNLVQLHFLAEIHAVLPFQARGGLLLGLFVLSYPLFLLLRRRRWKAIVPMVKSAPQRHHRRHGHQGGPPSSADPASTLAPGCNKRSTTGHLSRKGA
mmetsp:Transcript_62175/g.147315  ORF Transcript_62175/g.147315 Transcript_62175/m.147315 type:complete len:454 (-) Transcript_62175:118-1479(-)